MKGEYTSTARIRFSDCDPVGHLNNVKYLDYMLHAREDHVIDHYHFSYQEVFEKTGCGWVAISNKIAYLREVMPATKVRISSKIIKIGERTTTVELQMMDEEEQLVHAVMWTSAIFFNKRARRSAVHPPEVLDLLKQYLVEVPQSDFDERVLHLRQKNKLWRK